MPGAWLCLGCGGKTSPASYSGPSPARAPADFLAGLSRAFSPESTCSSFFHPASSSGGALSRSPRKELVPDQVQLPLHVVGVRRDGDDGVLLRQHDAELPVRAVAPVAPCGGGLDGQTG